MSGGMLRLNAQFFEGREVHPHRRFPKGIYIPFHIRKAHFIGGPLRQRMDMVHRLIDRRPQGLALVWDYRKRNAVNVNVFFRQKLGLGVRLFNHSLAALIPSGSGTLSRVSDNLPPRRQPRRRDIQPLDVFVPVINNIFPGLPAACRLFFHNATLDALNSDTPISVAVF